MGKIPCDEEVDSVDRSYGNVKGASSGYSAGIPLPAMILSARL